MFTNNYSRMYTKTLLELVRPLNINIYIYIYVYTHIYIYTSHNGKILHTSSFKSRKFD